MSEEEKEEISKNKENSKFSKEIFIRNLNFNTTEEKLKDFFIQFIPENSIEFCLIVKDKETNNSKGTAFIKLTEKSYNKLMNLYNESNKKKYSSLNEMNPFELEGRNLKLFDAISKNDIKNLEKEKDKKQSKRSKEFLYYGLSKESINNCDLIEEINDIDIQRREKLIQIKKDNYYNNPNFHVSLTRLALRNFEKNINENDIKKIIYDTINKNKEITKKYKNIKMIKQIK
jgi:nucleolar protein 4